MEQNIEGSEGIDVEQIGYQVTITLNRPEVMNAMTTQMFADFGRICSCLLYTSPSPRDGLLSRMPSSA